MFILRKNVCAEFEGLYDVVDRSSVHEIRACSHPTPLNVGK